MRPIDAHILMEKLQEAYALYGGGGTADHGILIAQSIVKKMPTIEPKERFVPIANFTFDKDKLREFAEEVLMDSEVTGTCPKCGEEVTLNVRSVMNHDPDR